MSAGLHACRHAEEELHSGTHGFTSLRQAESQLEQAHSQVIHKHELIARAHTMADNLQQLTLGVPFELAAPAAAPAAAAPTGE